MRSRHALFTKSLHPFDAGVAGAPALDASERLARYLNEQELKRQPNASASLWFARELRAQVEADLRRAEAEAVPVLAVGMY